MGESMKGGDNNAAFWLPSHFLTDDDFFADDHHHHRRKESSEPTPARSFDLFSNGGFDPFGRPSSALNSPASSTETDERDNNNNNNINDDDEDEFFAELTRHFSLSSLQETHNNTTTHEKPWVFSTSPQSTLTGFGPFSNRSGFSSNGSPNGPSQVPSPPLTPPAADKNDAAWELLYQAAGQVARLKMNAMAQMNQQLQHQQQNRGLLGAPRNPSLAPKSHDINTLYDFPRSNQFQQVKRQGSEMWAHQGGRQEREEWFCHHHHHNHHQQRRSCGGGGALGLPQSAWPTLRGAAAAAGQIQHHQHHHRQQQQQSGPGMRALFLNGSGSGSGPGSGPGMKRQSTGTGVFIPRRSGTQQQHQQQQPPPELPRKKPTGCSTVLLPARVVQALNLDLDEINGVNLSSQSRYGPGFVTDHEILMARRNALMGQQQQRRSLRQEGATAAMVGHEIRLPSDWTY